MITKASFYYCDSRSFDKIKAMPNSNVVMPSLFNMNQKIHDNLKQRQKNPILTKIIAFKVPKAKNL
jgi:hypothetical protein